MKRMPAVLTTIALAVALVIASVVDIRTRRLPDYLTLPLLTLGLLLALATAAD